MHAYIHTYVRTLFQWCVLLVDSRSVVCSQWMIFHSIADITDCVTFGCPSVCFESEGLVRSREGSFSLRRGQVLWSVGLKSLNVLSCHWLYEWNAREANRSRIMTNSRSLTPWQSTAQPLIDDTSSLCIQVIVLILPDLFHFLFNLFCHSDVSFILAIFSSSGVILGIFSHFS